MAGKYAIAAFNFNNMETDETSRQLSSHGNPSGFQWCS